MKKRYKKEYREKKLSNNWCKLHNIPMKRTKHLYRAHKKLIPLTTKEIDNILQQQYSEYMQCSNKRTLCINDVNISINNQDYTIIIDVKEQKHIENIFYLCEAEVNGIKTSRRDAMILNLVNLLDTIIRD